MKKVEITDDTGKIIKVDIKKFKKHIDEYHLNGSSVHEENGHYFTCLLYTSPSPRDFG